MAQAPLTQDEVIVRLRGQTLRILDLNQIFAKWPPATTNEHYGEIVPDIQAAVRSVMTGSQLSAEKRLKDDIALLTSLWYPNATLEQLRILGFYAVWLICWDDEVDANEGDLANDFEKAEAWREKTLHLVRRALGEVHDGDDNTLDAGSPLDGLMKTIGDSLRVSGKESYGPDQRLHFLQEIESFVRGCSTEQRLRIEQVVPAYDDYMTMRIETVAGKTLCALVDYANNLPTLPTIRYSAARQHIEKQVSVLLSLLNDLLSLKKELKTDCVINVVATLLTADNTLEAVVEHVVGMMKQAVEVFDWAAETLLYESNDQAEKEAAEIFIAGCRSIVTGTLAFTWVSLLFA